MTAARRILFTLALLVPAPAVAMSDIEERDTSSSYDTAHYDAGCYSGRVELPPDGTVLPETSPEGIAIPIALEGYDPDLVESITTVLVQDSAGAEVAGGFELADPGGLLVWRAASPLTVGASYRVTVTVDTGLVDPCSHGTAPAVYRYRVAVGAAQPSPAEPQLSFELQMHTTTQTTCCSGQPCVDTTLTSAELRVALLPEAGLAGWQRYTFAYFVDGSAWGEEVVAGEPGVLLERSLFVGDGAAHELCIEVGTYDAFTGTRTLLERHCETSSGGGGELVPWCPGEDVHHGGYDGYGGGYGDPYHDVDPGPGGGLGGDGGGGNGCGCTTLATPRSSPFSGTLLAVLALAGALVWRRRRTAA